VKLTTHFYLVPRSRIGGNIPPFHQYSFMAWCLVEAQGTLWGFSFRYMMLNPLAKFQNVLESKCYKTWLFMRLNYSTDLVYLSIVIRLRSG
jgi:hypothetical protein